MISQFGFCRVAALVPELHLANVSDNVAEILRLARGAVEGKAAVLVTPELSLTGYSCGDLFFQDTLLDAAEEGLREVLAETAGLDALLAVGLPVRLDGRLYNCAAVCHLGQLVGVIPKTHLPQRGEFYEKRWFVSGRQATRDRITLANQECWFGNGAVFTPDPQGPLRIGIEICEDLWAVEPPSGQLALAGATLLLNLSASPELLGKAAYRRELVRQQSARCLAAYIYVSSGPGESSSDLLYGGHAILAENGKILDESKRFDFAGQMVLTDIDVDFLHAERLRNAAFAESPPLQEIEVVELAGTISPPELSPLLRPVEATPFVPENQELRAVHCREIFSIQSTALARRIRHTGLEKVVLGVSGGLDSTLALLVCLHAFKTLELPAERILAVTMPGPGTSDRTKKNATLLAELLKVTLRTISVSEAVKNHLRDLEHPGDQEDVTFENAQARERTQILMDLANQEGAIVVGTGDLSEAALGWCTFNGDHMSMYHVNAGVPKTLVRYLISWCAKELYSGKVSEVLEDVCATPITPELLSLAADGSSGQETESLIGSYELHDFFLFHFLRRSAGPEKICHLAEAAFVDRFSCEEIRSRLELFLRRFFANQFKRNSQPDGPKVGSVALSPRGDWRMPSDASPALWFSKLPPPPST